jgi:hypothetical protein
MPDNPDVPAADGGAVVTPHPGLAALLAEARETWVARARDADERWPAEPAQVPAHDERWPAEAAAPGWRPFEDAFPTFYQFTNRPR